MKELVIDILEAYEEDRLPVSVIAQMYGVSIAMVQQVIDEYSESMAKAWKYSWKESSTAGLLLF